MPTSKPALEGIRVLDLGRLLAGPRCAMILARLGAEVIKVEPPSGDESRDHLPMLRGQSTFWVQDNSGKKSITLDLRQEKGKAILRELVKVSDIFIENFRPGTIDQMGFGYEVLRELNPRIIMVNVSGYGHYGPYRDRLGYEAVGQAISGHMFLTGFPDGPPTKTYSSVVARITALNATIGALAALQERSVSGQGQCIDVSLADSGFSLMEIPISQYLGTGEVQEREGNRNSEGMAPYNSFQCKDGWVYVTAVTTNTFVRLCQVIGKPEWAGDHDFASKGRKDHTEIIEAATSQWLADRTMDEAVEIMAKAGISIEKVNDIPTAARNPQIWERELLVEVPDPIAGSIHVSGKYIKLSRSETPVGSPPLTGQHTEEILHGLLGYPKEQVAALREEGVV